MHKSKMIKNTILGEYNFKGLLVLVTFMDKSIRSSAATSGQTD